MRYERKEQFERVNAFGTGTANTVYAQYFTGDSFLNPLPIRKAACSPPT